MFSSTLKIDLNQVYEKRFKKIDSMCDLRGGIGHQYK